MYSHSPTKEPISSSPTTQEIWHPVTKLFYPNPESEPYHLKLFKSSDRSTRSFCGTNLTYSINPKPSDAWPDLFDVVLGTIRRDDLEGEWMIPDRHCWVSKGIPWVGRLTNGIKEMPRHETFKLKEEMPKEAWDI
ncbi:hypothetical protein OCU04_008117 [Sclerotinia nivalis]|uniref:Uncharacterized protein n=1 Tax=Sclerotinia nivalis TaxID=352851 RepID=A0A9X0AL07_9HELO|nr:hypothetical protein OCU04_008117 [Sclerotinia nivalis]